MARRPKHGNSNTYAFQSDLDALSERVSQLEEDAIREDETVTIKKTCHIAKVKVVSVSPKKAQPRASAVRRLTKMGK